MKKKFAILLISVCSLMLAACGTNNTDTNTSTEPLVIENTTESTEQSEPVSEEADDSDVSEEGEITWVGTWYEEELGMEITVTENGNGYKFVVNWPDPDNNMTFVWEISGTPNEGGVIHYSDGVASVIETDEDGMETTSILSDTQQGSFALLYDGTLQWLEEVEVEVEHIFVKY